MKKIFASRIIFKDIVSDEKRIEAAYSRLFIIARRNILERRQLTNHMSQKYTEVQHGGNIFNNRGGIQKATG